MERGKARSGLRHTGATAKSTLSITTRSNLNSGIVRGGRSIDVTTVLGTSLMPISQILKLGRGAVVEDTLAVSVTDIIKSNID